jgi:putative transposase
MMLEAVECRFGAIKAPRRVEFAEAFVKTMKRDYVRVHPIPDAATALVQITGWFDDYKTTTMRTILIPD